MKKRHFLASLAGSTLARGVETTDWDAKPMREVVVAITSHQTLVEWYAQLLRTDAVIRQQFDKIAFESRQNSRDLKEEEPQAIEWLPAGFQSGRDSYQNKTGYLIIHPLSQDRPHHNNERLDIVISEARIVEDVIEDAQQKTTVTRRAYQFLGFRQLTLKPI